MFTIPPTLIYFCYSHWQDSYQQLKDRWGDRIIFSENVPSEAELTKAMGSDKDRHGIFVADDKAYEVQTQEKFFHDLVSRLSHHLRLSTILLVQDAGLNGKARGTLMKNCHANVFLKSPKERGFAKSLATLMGEFKYFMSAYSAATAKPFGYLVVDNHPRANELLKYRTNVLPNGSPCIIYRPEK